MVLMRRRLSGQGRGLALHGMRDPMHQLWRQIHRYFRLMHQPLYLMLWLRRFMHEPPR